MKKNTMIVMAGALGLVALTSGCGNFGPDQRDTASYQVSDKVIALDVRGDSGTVEVVESDRKDIQVTETLTWRGKSKPKPTHEVGGGTLTLKFDCPTAVGLSSCEVAYKVEVPKGLKIKSTTDSGTLALTGLSGKVEARTDSGTIEATGLSGQHFVAGSDSGTIELDFTAQPEDLNVITDSGTVRVHVPDGPYKITAKSDSGSEKITAKNDPASSRSISVTSDSGSLEVATP
ncbi:DUF4097 domain-containing protein [Nonomuraea sp. NBC_01738]|uniref:DUF4097 family beta strand repeat-containing protein n=1 Tax=Nonomuraea sp. NBC_01738 TaxID=2976003 RepID=UPI002E0DE7EE|nr:DUF4097 domain-containing protein [Nonomuraea sp. NBC_01738]